MSAARIESAAETLRVTYAPVLLGHEGHDWRDAPDISELLAELLVGLAAIVRTIELVGMNPDSELPEFRELMALVERIEVIK